MALLRCDRCHTVVEYLGSRKFNRIPSVTGLGGAADGAISLAAELFDREQFDVYSCPQCGKVEIFLRAVGRESRHVYQQGTLDESIEMLDDDDPGARLLAVKRLREFGMAPPNVSVVNKALSRAMHDQLQEVRNAAREVCQFLSTHRHLGYQFECSEPEQPRSATAT